MKLYHASTVVVDHPDVEHSRPNLDFGASEIRKAESSDMHLESADAGASSSFC